jgi:hypothetical protein
LQTVGDLKVWSGSAEVDKVVPGCEGRNLSGFLYRLAIVQKASGDDRVVKRERVLDVRVVGRGGV